VRNRLDAASSAVTRVGVGIAPYAGRSTSVENPHERIGVPQLQRRFSDEPAFPDELHLTDFD
jgi:hypothetical protein